MKISRIIMAAMLVAATGSRALAVQGPDGHFDEWEKVTMEDLKMTECSFEKNADAVLLLDLAHVYYSQVDDQNGKFRVTTAYYQRFKVFTDKGTRRANHKLSLRISSKEEAKNIRGISYNIVKGMMTKTELKQEDIHWTKLSEYENQVSFTVPDVSAGSVFEVGYERQQDVTYTLPAWYFTSDVPSVKSSLTVGFITPIQYYIDKHGFNDTLEEKSQEFTANISIPDGGFGLVQKKVEGEAITYTTHNLKSFKVEPYTNAGKNYMTWIGFQLRRYGFPFNTQANSRLITTFPRLAAHLYDDDLFSKALDDDPVPSKELKLLKSEGSPEATARAIYDYVRYNMKWNGQGGIKPLVANKVIWKNKTGSKAEINILLISLLRDAGITSYPMLTGSRYRGSMNTTYPILDEYIGLDAMIEWPDGRKTILDATNKQLPYGEPANEQLNTSGLVLKGSNDTYWVQVKERMPSTLKVAITAALDENAMMRGTMDLTYTNHLAADMERMKNRSTETMLRDYLKKQIPNATIESVTDTMDAAACRFVQKVTFSMQATTDNDGNMYVSASSLFGTNANVFISKDRVSDVDFGHSDRLALSMRISLPAGYTSDSVMKPVLISTGDSSAVFKDEVKVQDGAIQWSQQVDYLKSFYPVWDYREFFEFEKKYYDLRQRPVVLRKKI